MERLKNRDLEIAQIKRDISAELSKGKNCDEETLLDLMDDLDLHTFTEIQTGQNKKSNALIESLTIGLTKVLDYAFNDGLINIRAVMKKNNFYEIKNELALFDISFFKNHFDNLKLLKRYYSHMVDFL
jgi:hypothetical protein